MKIDIQSPGFTVNPQLTGFINEKVEKLSRYCGEIISCEVALSLDKSDTKENKLCEIRLAIPGNDLLARAQCRTFEEATTKVVEALKRQIKNLKAKTIIKRKNVTGIKNFYND